VTDYVEIAMDATCVVCEEISGGIAVPGGALHSSEHSLVVHTPPLDGRDVYLGHLLVVPRRHVADFAGLNDGEAADVGISLHLASRRLKSVGATYVYVMTIGHSVEHLHVHLLPRWPETPPEIPWHSVDEWSGARRGGFDDAATFAMRLVSEMSD
jgi:diadenosine tetraphosphate (Ap4A) HIT family hydrolase